MMKQDLQSWFDGIRHGTGGWFLEGLKFADGRTLSTAVPLIDAVHADMVSFTQQEDAVSSRFYAELDPTDLDSGGKVLGSAAVVRRFLPGLRASNRHAILRFCISDQTYLIPALFFVNRLFLANSAIAHFLFQPGMFESMVDPKPAIDADSITLRLPLCIHPSRCAGALAKAMAWLASDSTARNAWRSVWSSAMRGNIDVDLPRIRMRGHVGGYEVGEIRLVTWSRGLSFDLGLPQKIVVVSNRGVSKEFTSR